MGGESGREGGREEGLRGVSQDAITGRIEIDGGRVLLSCFFES